MADPLTGFRDDHFRDQLTMAFAVVSLKAKQAASPAGRERFGFSQCQLGFRRFHMRVEYRDHPLGVSRSYRITAGFWRPQPLEMDVADSGAIEAGGKLTLREPRLSRCRDGPNINQQTDIGFGQRC